MKHSMNWITGLATGLMILSAAACGSAPAPTATTVPAATAAPTTAAPTTAAPTTAAPTAAEAATAEIARPSNAGGPGEAINLKGDATSGAKIFVDNCKKCHGDEGKGGVANPGASEDVPALNPIDDTLIDKDAKVYATNLDLFLEHGSTPEGTKPEQVMTAFGDEKKLTPQQIADVIAYVMSLNPAK